VATFDGNITFASGFTDDSLNPDFGGWTDPDHTVGLLPFTTQLLGDLSDTQPVDEPKDLKGGSVVDVFGYLDFWNRIHVTPLIIDLGNLLDIQVREISIWNAFFTPQTLNSVVGANTEGLDLTEPEAAPYAIASFQEIFYQVSVSTEGPATVDASYTFDFDSADYTVRITGVRIVAWQWEPNWISPVIERLQWKTDVIPAYDGSEQRIQLREFPRVEWEFTFDAEARELRTLENVVYAWGGRVWALPIWPDIQRLEQELVAGAEEIPIDFIGRDYRADGLGVLIGFGQFESFEVEGFTSSSLILKRPLLNTWPAGSRVYPARSSTMEEPRSLGRFTGSLARGIARFKTAEEIERDELAEEIYRGYPVMTRELNWREAPEIDYARKMASLDFETGQAQRYDEAELALPAHSVRMTFMDRDECNWFRQWLYARRGRARGIWLPTWAEDLQLVEIISPSQLTIFFEACGLVHFAQGDVHRRDVRIELRSGEIFYRRLTAPVKVTDDIERMTMSSVLNIEVPPSNVRRISWMNFVRLDTDSIEIAWAHGGQAEAALSFKGPRNDI
jgi:hypothetical protein